MENKNKKPGTIHTVLLGLSTVLSGAALALYLQYGTNKLVPEILMPCVVALSIAAGLGLLLTVLSLAGRKSMFFTYVLYLAGLVGFAEYMVSQLNYIANVFYGVDGNSFTPAMIATAVTALMGWIFSLTAAVRLRRAARRSELAAQNVSVKEATHHA